MTDVAVTSIAPQRPARSITPPASAQPKMLELPKAGHELARRWWYFGLAAYIVLAGALVGGLIVGSGANFLSLIGLGERFNLPILIMVGAGLLLTAVAFGKAWKDIALMKREEVDVEWVHKKGKPGLPLVFVDPKKRESMLGEVFDTPEHEMRVETLIDDRVRRVRNASVNPDAGAVVPEELRGIAEVRTAQYGSFPRYASSLLLLLAVLGTFAGVKTALPGLIDSITTSTGTQTASAANEGLIRSLNAVAEAFGGNALALVGAIALGIVAQGVGFGRRNLLERLELVSAEFLYGQRITVDANPMQAAMVALRETAQEMHSASASMLGIEDQLQLLGREFKSAFAGLANRMHDIAVGQEEALYAKTAESIETLQRRVSDLADAVEENARTYAGLAEGVKLRSQEASRAFDAMAESNKKLGAAVESIVSTGERSRTSVDELKVAVDHMKQSSEYVTAEVHRVAAATESISPVVQQLGSTLDAAGTRLRESERAAQEGWRALAAEVASKLDVAIKNAREASGAPLMKAESTNRGESFDGQASQALATIASRLEHLKPQPQPIWKAAVGPFIGVVLGLGLVSLVPRVISYLTRFF